MSEPSRLEHEAALRRELLRSARHAEAGMAHVRTRERIDAAARILAAHQPETKEQ